MTESRIRIAVVAAVLSGVLLGYGQNKPAVPFQPAGPFRVVETTIDDIHAAMKSGKLTAHGLVQAYLDRMIAFDKQGPALNCVISLNPRVLEEADRLDAAFKRSGMVGPLHGIPVLVKDEIDTAGMPTTL